MAMTIARSMMDNAPDLLIVELTALFHDLSGECLADCSTYVTILIMFCLFFFNSVDCTADLHRISQ